MYNISKEGIDLIIKSEGCELNAYVDPGTGAEPITIGYGSTLYEDGTKVKLGDQITKERAYQLFVNTLKPFVEKVNKMVTSKISQHQFDALTSFCYNLGPQNLKTSTLLKKVNTNPLDASIAAEFKKWNKANGKVLEGLVKRRASESELYFKS